MRLLPRCPACRAVAAALALVLAAGGPVHAQVPRFVVSDSSVRQGPFLALAYGRDTIVSTYPRAAREVRFRFSIDGRENEFPSGTEHTIYLRPRQGRVVTALYVFGVEDAPAPPAPAASAGSDDGIAQVTFRVDLRAVRRALAARGAYQPPLGERIERGGLAHVYVLGDPAPLTWDYGALRPGSPLELTDPDGDGIYEGTVAVATEYTRPRLPDGRAVWARHGDLSAYPSLESSQRLQDALYRLSLEELTQLVRADGALSAGAKWPGVWTRDVALSSLLSLVFVAPDAVRRSLLAKVDSSGRIIQDTGTGGSWPVSSDRMVWALAAMELYEVTGDRAWLRQAYDITRRSALADLHAARDGETGLFDGESSFMDWREQSYPRWMQPADIQHSQSLSTNAVDYGAYRALATMARALGEPAAPWDSIASGVQRGLGGLWLPARGWYAEYRYGRVYPSLSPRTDGLGEALMIVLGATTAAERTSLLARTPVMAFGAPSFWPFIPGERFYHNATIWPFVTAYWSWAGAEGGNTAAVERGLDAAARATALFLTNKENTVAATGHFEGTALNSDRQLWSVAGTLASTYRLLLGMRLEAGQLAFRPMIPPRYAGVRHLAGLRYRGATLDVTVRGFGSAVASVRLDGAAVPHAVVPATVSGVHALEIVMNGRWPAAPAHLVEARFAPATPVAAWRDGSVRWSPVPAAARYEVYRNGRSIARTRSTAYAARASRTLQEYQVRAVNAAGDASFLSEPLRVVAPEAVLTLKPAQPLERRYAGFTGEGYRTLSVGDNRTVALPVTIARGGTFAVDARYANGNGPVNTDDKVAVRTLLVDADTAGVLVMPQRGAGRWTEWGWSNTILVPLAAGPHVLTLVYTPLDANMNGRENTASFDHLRLVPRAGPLAPRGSRLPSRGQ